MNSVRTLRKIRQKPTRVSNTQEKTVKNMTNFSLKFLRKSLQARVMSLVPSSHGLEQLRSQKVTPKLIKELPLTIMPSIGFTVTDLRKPG